MTMKGHEVYKKLLEQYAEAYRAWIDTGEKEYLHRYHAIRDIVHDALRMEYSESRTKILMNSAIMQPKLESGTNCVESDADPLLHASYVDHDGNVVFVD